MSNARVIPVFMLLLIAAGAVAWAVAWPVDAPAVPPPSRLTPEQAPAAAPMLPPPGSFAMLWERRWQTWAPPAASASASATATSTAPAQTTLKTRYVGVILEQGRSFGFFVTPYGSRYAAAGQRLGVESDAPLVLSVEPARAVLRLGDREHVLTLQRDPAAPPPAYPVSEAPPPVSPDMQGRSGW